MLKWSQKVPIMLIHLGHGLVLGDDIFVHAAPLSSYVSN